MHVNTPQYLYIKLIGYGIDLVVNYTFHIIFYVTLSETCTFPIIPKFSEYYY